MSEQLLERTFVFEIFIYKSLELHKNNNYHKVNKILYQLWSQTATKSLLSCFYSWIYLYYPITQIIVKLLKVTLTVCLPQHLSGWENAPPANSSCNCLSIVASVACWPMFARGGPRPAGNLTPPFLLVIYIWASVIDARCAWGSGACPWKMFEINSRWKAISCVLRGDLTKYLDQ